MFLPQEIRNHITFKAFQKKLTIHCSGNQHFRKTSVKVSKVHADKESGDVFVTFVSVTRGTSV